jgi:broad specificity phosphatase PhoE
MFRSNNRYFNQMEPGAKLLIFLRHGERSDEAPTTRQLQYDIRSDPPLTERGHLMAEHAARRVMSMIPDNSDIHIVSSPLIRCIQTITKVARLVNLPIHLEEGFGETFTLHDFPYNPYDRLHIRVERERFQDTIQGMTLIENDHIRRPEYPESMESLYERVRYVLPRYIEKVKENVIVICSHWLPIIAFTDVIGGDMSKVNKNYCLITAARAMNGKYDVITEFDYSHLPDEFKQKT